MAKWILTIFVISSSPNISWTDLVYRLYAVFEIIVTRIFSHNSNLSFSSSLVSSCIPFLQWLLIKRPGMTKMAAVFFLNDHPLLFSHQPFIYPDQAGPSKKSPDDLIQQTLRSSRLDQSWSGLVTR